MIPQVGIYAWGYDAATGIVTTPTTTQAEPWTDSCNEHATTVRSYPDGFILEIEFRFDSNQLPVFPATNLARHKHRPTFLGNSGVGIYSWTGNPRGKYLYEVQITDVSGMMNGSRTILQKNRFLRLDYGPNWTQRGVWAPLSDPTIPEATILANEMMHYDPDKYAPFKSTIDDGGADSICAFVAGLPVSYFKDVYLSGGGEEFPKPGIAVTSQIPQRPAPPDPNPNPLPISGVEDPRDMYWGNRGDYVPNNGGAYTHFNHLDSGAWNTLRICFRPARYKTNGEKCANAYLHTQVNATEAYGGGFDGEIKSGTRASRHTNAQDPEPDVYKNGNGDMKIRLLGHWGSLVQYRNVTIRSEGSIP